MLSHGREAPDVGEQHSDVHCIAADGGPLETGVTELWVLARRRDAEHLAETTEGNEAHGAAGRRRHNAKKWVWRRMTAVVEEWGVVSASATAEGPRAQARGGPRQQRQQ